MKILTVTSLYPNPAQPEHGVFVENRLHHLLAGGCISCRMVAPVPWFPGTDAHFDRYARFARVPRKWLSLPAGGCQGGAHPILEQPHRQPRRHRARLRHQLF